MKIIDINIKKHTSNIEAMVCPLNSFAGLGNPVLNLFTFVHVYLSTRGHSITFVVYSTTSNTKMYLKSKMYFQNMLTKIKER